MFYLLQNSRTTTQQLKSADKIIKSSIKKFMHLSSHTPDVALYARIRDEGLGIPELTSTSHIRYAVDY